MTKDKNNDKEKREREREQIVIIKELRELQKYKIVCLA